MLLTKHSAIHVITDVMKGVIMPNFKRHLVLWAAFFVPLVLAACSDSDSNDSPPPVVTSPITGQWTATEGFLASNDITTIAGEYTLRVTLEETAGDIVTNINAVNEVLIMLEQPTATTLETRRQGDPSFVTGTLNGTQVTLEVNIGTPLQPASLVITGSLQNDTTITGETTLALFGVTATSPVTMTKQ